MTDTLTQPDGGALEMHADVGPHSAADVRAEVHLAEVDHAEAVQLFAERLLTLLASGTTLLTIELGRRHGLYRALHEHGRMTPPALARVTGIVPRYAREWLEQQAAAGILSVDDPAEPADLRTFSVPAAHVPVLIEATHPAHTAPAAGLLAGVALAFPEVVEDFRLGRGVAFDEYGAELRQGLGALNRPGFHHFMRDWVACLPDRAARLDAGGVVLDAGCGTGRSTIGLAQAFPEATVVGIDLDAASILEARAHAAAEGVDDRVVFLVGNAADADAVRAAAELVRADGFDLVTVFGALHDMGRPTAALAAFRGALRTGGAVLVADERVADAFTPDSDHVEQMLYAMSVLHCLPATTAESAEVANGTVLRAPTVRGWAAAAGFGRVDELGIEHPAWRFYRIG
ncbi:bifunctional 2-polyprenyl-6-hydroxyphenol methylase/3-demethylubiquinol 3-O-methyltransferase UbiG [Agromyces sp. LHK192]|uniref:class I SAM-dependent methyltransferase n=1 Tax=Agromyces sp. LHK192 TaxID=2498704 RepID=UPI000FDC622E|nr:class I SAM-dependent methyltransferase [Agromyces sp. LHK192]